jgi:hypothetical protein
MIAKQKGRRIDRDQMALPIDRTRDAALRRLIRF